MPDYLKSRHKKQYTPGNEEAGETFPFPLVLVLSLSHVEYEYSRKQVKYGGSKLICHEETLPICGCLGQVKQDIIRL